MTLNKTLDHNNVSDIYNNIYTISTKNELYKVVHYIKSRYMIWTLIFYFDEKSFIFIMLSHVPKWLYWIPGVNKLNNGTGAIFMIFFFL